MSAAPDRGDFWKNGGQRHDRDGTGGTEHTNREAITFGDVIAGST